MIAQYPAMYGSNQTVLVDRKRVEENISRAMTALGNTYRTQEKEKLLNGSVALPWLLPEKVKPQTLL